MVSEARALIPTFGPNWTNHNASDPGITLVELFAWLSEMLLFRTNQITPDAQLTFARLLVGPAEDLTPPPGLIGAARASWGEDRLRRAVAELRAPYRAVTAGDYEQLARDASPDVWRVRCVPLRDLGVSATDVRPGELSLAVLPRATAAEPDAVLAAVASYLEPRRLLTTRVHVVPRGAAPVRIESFVARRSDVVAEDLETAVSETLKTFLDMYEGGPDGTGWPFGRNVFVSELMSSVEALPGVDYVPELSLEGTDPIWHESGALVGLALAPHELPDLADPGGITLYVSDRFVSIHVAVTVTADAAVADVDVRRGVQAAIRRVFHPATGGPDGTKAWSDPNILDTLVQALAPRPGGTEAVSGVAGVEVPTLTTVPERTTRVTSTEISLTIQQGELADVETIVTVERAP
jgi:hypothetical protein